MTSQGAKLHPRTVAAGRVDARRPEGVATVIDARLVRAELRRLRTRRSHAAPVAHPTHARRS